MKREHSSILPQTVAVDIKLTLPPAELTRVCRNIETAITHNGCHVVQFLSSYPAEGSGIIAFETAVIAATLFSKRVLYIDSQTAHRHPVAQFLSTYVPASIDAQPETESTIADAIVTVAGTKLSYATLSHHESGHIMLADTDILQSAIAALRQSFDLILIDSPAVLTTIFSTVLAKLCDGCILVIEAERTRAPVAAQTVRMIEASGGKMLGAILNRRRLYIPQWLYRVLYRKKDTLY